MGASIVIGPMLVAVTAARRIGMPRRVLWVATAIGAGQALIPALDQTRTVGLVTLLVVAGLISGDKV